MDYIRYNSLRFMADIVIDFPDRDYRNAGVHLYTSGNRLDPILISEIPPASRIFVKTDLLDSASNLLRAIRVPFHLITGSSDLAPAQGEATAEQLKKSTKMCSWVGNNLAEHFPWMLTIPIGLAEQARINSPPEFLPMHNLSLSKDIDILVTYMSPTSNIRNEVDALRQIDHSNRLKIIGERQSYLEYLGSLSKAHYVLCLPGNGHDTIRVYESILCNAIPLVLKSPIWRMHRSLGCVVLDKLEEFRTIPQPGILKPSDRSCVDFSFWRKKIFHHQVSCFRC